MEILITVGSRHGSTVDIGNAIADTLHTFGHHVTCPTIDVARTMPASRLDQVDAFVVGSAVYGGRWLESPRRFVEALTETLRGRPLWLFSSGPVGDPPKPEDDPVDIAGLIEDSGARGHVIFAGRLDRSLLTFGERAIVMALRAPEGDFRDWDAVAGWATEISAELDADLHPSEPTPRDSSTASTTRSNIMNRRVT